MPNAVSEGPVATIATVLLVEPLTMKPAIITLLPVSTCMRVERFTSRASDGPGGGGGGGGTATQLPVTLPVPLVRKSAVATQPAVMTIWLGVVLPSTTFSGVPVPLAPE